MLSGPSAIVHFQVVKVRISCRLSEGTHRLDLAGDKFWQQLGSVFAIVNFWMGDRLIRSSFVFLFLDFWVRVLLTVQKAGSYIRIGRGDLLLIMQSIIMCLYTTLQLHTCIIVN